MPVRQLRRIGAATGDSLFDRMKAHTLQNVDRRPAVDALERDHPDLIVSDEANLLAALGGPDTARLIYGFEDARAFADRFPDMLDKLLPRVRRVLRADTVRFRLAYAPARSLVEPVLRRLWFSPSRDWMEFSLAKTTKLPAAPAPRGIRFRDGSIDDLDDILRIDREAFPDTPIPVDAMRERLREDSLIIAMAGSEIAGFSIFSAPEPGAGWINVIAVDEGHRGGGIGAALTVRAAKRLFAGGAQDVGLTTDEDNASAIRLYVRLGFKQTRAGRDYTRPTDPRAIEAMKTGGEGTLIRFGGWR